MSLPPYGQYGDGPSESFYYIDDVHDAAQKAIDDAWNAMEVKKFFGLMIPIWVDGKIKWVRFDEKRAGPDAMRAYKALRMFAAQGFNLKKSCTIDGHEFTNDKYDFREILLQGGTTKRLLAVTLIEINTYNSYEYCWEGCQF